MSIELLTDRYAKQIAGTISCYDRMVLFGTLPQICYAEGMTSLLCSRNIRIFDYPPLCRAIPNQIRDNAQKLAADHGIEIEHIRKKNFRKETGSGRSSTSAASNPAWWGSSRPWSRARRSSGA